MGIALNRIYDGGIQIEYNAFDIKVISK